MPLACSLALSRSDLHAHSLSLLSLLSLFSQIVGNPHILDSDPCWRALIQFCVESDTYRGCRCRWSPGTDAFDDGVTLLPLRAHAFSLANWLVTLVAQRTRTKGKH